MEVHSLHTWPVDGCSHKRVLTFSDAFLYLLRWIIWFLFFSLLIVHIVCIDMSVRKCLATVVSLAANSWLCLDVSFPRFIIGKSQVELKITAKRQVQMFSFASVSKCC